MDVADFIAAEDLPLPAEPSIDSAENGRLGLGISITDRGDTIDNGVLVVADFRARPVLKVDGVEIVLGGVGTALVELKSLGLLDGGVRFFGIETCKPGRLSFIICIGTSISKTSSTSSSSADATIKPAIACLSLSLFLAMSLTVNPNALRSSSSIRPLKLDLAEYEGRPWNGGTTRRGSLIVSSDSRD